MLTFKTLEGNTLQYGETEVPELEDEKAFILKLDEQLRAADPKDKEHVTILQSNVNQIASILNLDNLPEDGVMEGPTVDTLQYFNNNRELFIEYGITNHARAKQLEKMTAPAFTPTEFAPTIDEMIKLEVDIGQLYED
tara:strand:- start:453 stop:866 length:414 start_codon:yes stop_codon:yes gene_type:complete